MEYGYLTHKRNNLEFVWNLKNGENHNYSYLKMYLNFKIPGIYMKINTISLNPELYDT